MKNNHPAFIRAMTNRADDNEKDVEFEQQDGGRSSRLTTWFIVGVGGVMALFFIMAVAARAKANSLARKDQGSVITATQQPSGRYIRVSGQSSARVAPDIATVHLGVVSHGPTARAATDDTNVKVKVLVRALLEQPDVGLSREDITTLQFTVTPEYAKHGRNGGAEQQPASIVGYQAQQDIQVVTGKVSVLGLLLDRALESGANHVYAVQFSVGQDALKNSERQMRSSAIHDAKRIAQDQATASDAVLGSVISIENAPDTFPGLSPVTMSREGATAALQMEPGMQEIKLSVVVTYELLLPLKNGSL